ncbi:hypothetical protein AVEN_275107-1 [Araneus ventricosus]|uniref:Uncharacterized protein n=1 Tax=Araneus ventricosus TaxID=182803 RepID=A0A4Y2J5L0_ARAVE|nr:hypothetical protein AVEN_275107-1 [Araneus ventricosus]
MPQILSLQSQRRCSLKLNNSTGKSSISSNDFRLLGFTCWNWRRYLESDLIRKQMCCFQPVDRYCWWFTVYLHSENFFCFSEDLVWISIRRFQGLSHSINSQKYMGCFNQIRTNEEP